MGPGQGLSPFWDVGGISLLSPFQYKTYFQLENFLPENYSLKAERLLQLPKGMVVISSSQFKNETPPESALNNQSRPRNDVSKGRAPLCTPAWERNPQPPQPAVQSSFLIRQTHQYLRDKVPLRGTGNLGILAQVLCVPGPVTQGFCASQHQPWCLESFRAHKVGIHLKGVFRMAPLNLGA